MDIFLENNLSKLTQGEIDNLNRPLPILKIELIINNLQKQKATGPNGFTGGFYQIFKQEIIPTLYNLFQRVE